MAHEAWKAELQFGIPLPEKLYCSPMSRALLTSAITFENLLVEERKKGVILEVSSQVLSLMISLALILWR